MRADGWKEERLRVEQVAGAGLFGLPGRYHGSNICTLCIGKEFMKSRVNLHNTHYGEGNLVFQFKLYAVDKPVLISRSLALGYIV